MTVTAQSATTATIGKHSADVASLAQSHLELWRGHTNPNTDEQDYFFQLHAMVSASAWWCVVIAIAHATAFGTTWPGCPQETPRPVIQPGAPDNVTTYLNLQECNITKIEFTHLMLPNLETLILSKNNIERLDKDVFKFVPQLRALFLGYNRLQGKDLTSGVFHNCRGLQRIGFTGNDMSGTSINLLEELDSLHTLWLDNCSLQEVPHFSARPSLLDLNLYNNQIKALDNPGLFIKLGNLQRLHLYNNLIEFIHNDTFKHLTNIVSVHLNRNHIRYLPDYLFTNLTNLRTINLENNHIEYIPPHIFSGCKNLSHINVAINRLTFLPEKFVGQFGKLEQIYFDRNPWQCGCLNEILVDVKEKSVRYRDKYYNGSVPVCVSLDFRCHRMKDVYREIYYTVTGPELVV